MQITQRIRLTVAVVAVALVAASSGGAARAEGALDQLKRATSGTQSTGKTFDGASRPLPTDAYPKANAADTAKPSTGTASGYSVNTSSATVSVSTATASSPPKGK